MVKYNIKFKENSVRGHALVSPSREFPETYKSITVFYAESGSIEKSNMTTVSIDKDDKLEIKELVKKNTGYEIIDII